MARRFFPSSRLFTVGAALAILMTARASAAPAASRIVIYKVEHPSEVFTLPAGAVELAKAKGFSPLVDYDIMAVFRGAQEAAAELLSSLDAAGYHASLAAELDRAFFHDHFIDADAGPSTSRASRASVLHFLFLQAFPKTSWLQELAAGNVRVLAPLAPAGYLVRADADELAALVSRLWYVRSTYPVPAEWKPFGVEHVGDDVGPLRKFVVQVSEEGPGESLEQILGSFSEGEVTRVDRREGRATYHAALADTDVGVLAAIDRVFEITPLGRLALSSERQAQLVAKPGSETGGGATLPASNATPYLDWLGGKVTLDPTQAEWQATKVGIIDSGFDNGDISDAGIHPDFRFYYSGSPFKVVTNQTSAWEFNEDRDAHGTLVASVVAGYPAAISSRIDGQGYSFGMGLAPPVRIAMDKYINCEAEGSGGLEGAILRLLPTGANVLNISLNAKDSDGGCAYLQQWSNVVDNYTRNNGVLFTISAGNSPEGCAGNYVRAPGTAKNGLTLGSTDNFTIDWSSSSFVGTCAWCTFPPGVQDARRIPSYSAVRYPFSVVKPDLVAPSTRITGPITRSAVPACQTVFCNPNITGASDPAEKYAMVAGTSFAAPAGAGAAAVVRAWYTNIRGVPPFPAMTKAMLINGARDIAGAQVRNEAYNLVETVGHIPNQYQGWGMLSLERLLGSATNHYFLDQSVTFTQSGGFVKGWKVFLLVRDGSKATHVTLVWSDPQQQTSGQQYTAINNLNLQVCGGSICYDGNRIDGTTGLSIPAPPTINDSVNNVERVIVPANTFGTGSQITVRVTPQSITVPQNFALVTENAGQ